jgi:hypothetical protein
MLYLSLRIVNEKQQDIKVVLPVASLRKRQEVNTAFCPASNAMFPYF